MNHADFGGAEVGPNYQISLNDALYRGPVILTSLVGMLLRFRTYPIALVSNIEKAFLQVGFQE